MTTKIKDAVIGVWEKAALKDKLTRLKAGELSKKELIDLIKIVASILVITLSVIIGLSIILNARVIKVELSVGDTYQIEDVIPDKDIDFSDTDGIVEYTITLKAIDSDLTSFVITARKEGKLVLKVTDKDGHKYKYKIRIKEAK